MNCPYPDMVSSVEPSLGIYQTRFMKYLLLLFFLLPIISHAQQRNKFDNHRDTRAQEETVDEQIDQIPIFRDKVEGDYVILGEIDGQDVFNKNIKGIVKQIRVKAYQLKADAVKEFSCQEGWKKTFQYCAGYAIKYK